MKKLWLLSLLFLFSMTLNSCMPYPANVSAVAVIQPPFFDIPEIRPAESPDIKPEIIHTLGLAEPYRPAEYINPFTADIPGSAVSEPEIEKPRIALTFDDGPSSSTTLKILELLRQYNVKATFFVIGENAALHPELMRAIAGDGHSIGNHTYTHPYLSKLSEAKRLEEINKTNEAVYNACGITPKLLRPPYGALSRDVKVLAGLDVVTWNVDPRDWEVRDAQIIYDNVMAYVKEKSIILLHDLRIPTVEALELLLPVLCEKYELVTVEQLLSSVEN